MIPVAPTFLWRAGAAVVIVLAALVTGWIKGAAHEQAKHQVAEARRVEAQQGAILARLAENRAELAHQKAVNADITKGKNDEIRDLTARITAAGRLRVGTAICGGPAGTPAPDVPGSGDGADQAGRLVREDVDRDLKALIVAMETDAATGRACQAAAREHGFAD